MPGTPTVPPRTPQAPQWSPSNRRAATPRLMGAGLGHERERSVAQGPAALQTPPHRLALRLPLSGSRDRGTGGAGHATGRPGPCFDPPLGGPTLTGPSRGRGAFADSEPGLHARAEAAGDAQHSPPPQFPAGRESSGAWLAGGWGGHPSRIRPVPCRRAGHCSPPLAASLPAIALSRWRRRAERGPPPIGSPAFPGSETIPPPPKPLP